MMLAQRWRAVFTATDGRMVVTAACFAAEDDALWHVALVLGAAELAATLPVTAFDGTAVAASAIDADADAWAEAVAS